MDRGLRVPLSPREQAALIRIAQGSVRGDELAFEDRRRFKMLSLIQETDGELLLTETGRERAASITPKPPKWIADKAPLKRPQLG